MTTQNKEKASAEVLAVIFVLVVFSFVANGWHMTKGMGGALSLRLSNLNDVVIVLKC